MRAIGGYIQQLWQRGGPFHGDEARPNARVTVQLPWNDGLPFPEYIVRPTSDNIGTYAKRGAPLRWFQKGDNSQVEVGLPNVASIDIDRSIDNGAGTCHLTLLNQKMDPIGESTTADQLGQPGYYTFDHGANVVAQRRWGHQLNPFYGLLFPNSILRTYQGFGGSDKTLTEAVTDGNLILTGVWIIDKVAIGADGKLQIDCRDPMKLLIDQMIYTPPIPKSGDLNYPLTYRRWILEYSDVKASDKRTTELVPGDKNTAYSDSSSDRWYSYDADIHGHHPLDATDGNPNTWWLGEGNSAPERSFAVNWIEYNCGEDINSVYINPWAGGYQVFVSVMEHGEWQGTNSVFYDYHPLIGTQPTVVNTGADIPYVFTAGVPWETAQEYVLDRAYSADKVRLTFRNLVRTEFGPWLYRAGIREVKLRASGNGIVVSTSVPAIAFGAAPDYAGAGYWTVTENDQVDTFGDAQEFPYQPSSVDAVGLNSSFSNTIRAKRDGTGYWVLDNNGHVRAHGSAVHYGDFRTIHEVVVDPQLRDPAFELAITNTENGYWITRNDGRVYAFGDAENYVSSISMAPGVMLATADGHPTAMGLWLCDQAGIVHAYGAAVHLGDATLPTKVTALRSTTTGDGYWVMCTDSSVQAFGDAWVWPDPNPFDAPTSWTDTYWDLIPSPDDLGYGVLKGTGEIFPRGTFNWFGGPIPGHQAQHRKPGNYLDYSDVIADLALWAGFLLYEEVAPNARPSVWGSIESTGAYSDDDLPLDMFDKKPFIDAMNQIKEIVGYLLYVDDDGSLIFTSPNWWAPGNFDENGFRVNVIPEIDETIQLLSYTAQVDDQSLVSEILISSEDPDQAEVGTVAIRLVPLTAKGLRGISKPFMWINGAFQKKEEMTVMAELIALHTWFQQRLGNVSCVANPCIQVNDQVRIWERISGETYIHYVRGVSTSQDLQGGSYTMTLTTNWLGDKDVWAITDQSGFTPTIVDGSTYPGTPILVTSPSFGLTDATWAVVSKNQNTANNVTLGQEQPVVTTMAQGDPPDADGAANP